MKRICALLILLLLMIFAHVGLVRAHELKSDGNITALLHVSPDDNPVSGRATSTTLYFSDSTNRFTLSDCNCHVIVQDNSQTIYSQPLANTSALTSTNSFIFPKADTYSVIVSGNPVKARTFQSFRFTFSLSVEASGLDNNKQSSPALLWVGLSTMVSLVVLGGVIMEFKSSQKKKP